MGGLRGLCVCSPEPRTNAPERPLGTPPTHHAPKPPKHPQVLGRHLEAAVTRAMELKAKMGDSFVSVEHLVLALADDPRFGEGLFRGEGLTRAKLDEAVKEVGGEGGGGVWVCVSPGVTGAPGAPDPPALYQAPLTPPPLSCSSMAPWFQPPPPPRTPKHT